MKTLEFTLTVSNCLGCLKCPQDKLGAAYVDAKRKMSRDDFSAILGKLPKDCRIDFSGYSECFLHPLAPDFIAEAVNRGFKVHLYTTLIGLTPEGAEKLSLNSPEYVRLHAPDMKEFKYDPHRWLAQLEMFKAKAQLPYAVMAMSEVSPAISNAMTIDYPPMLSRGGNLWEREKIKGHLHCAMDRWHSNVILPNGDVYLCCQDWSLTTRLGNLLNQSYSEIIAAGERYRDEPPEICRSCEWAVKA